MTNLDHLVLVDIQNLHCSEIPIAQFNHDHHSCLHLWESDECSCRFMRCTNPSTCSCWLPRGNLAPSIIIMKISTNHAIVNPSAFIIRIAGRLPSAVSQLNHYNNHNADWLPDRHYFTGIDGITDVGTSRSRRRWCYFSMDRFEWLFVVYWKRNGWNVVLATGMDPRQAGDSKIFSGYYLE